jgi:hypothetical protein
MYWYYFQASRGIRVWWKRYITQLQIIQFIVDIGMLHDSRVKNLPTLISTKGFIYFAMYTGFVSVLWPWLPNKGNCAGEPEGAYIGTAIITSYLVLFLAFYMKTYGQNSKDFLATKGNKIESAAILAENAWSSEQLGVQYISVGVAQIS